MTSPRFNHLAAVFAVLAMAMPGTPASAESPDGFLLSAAFATRDKTIALARIESGLKAADLLIARNPHDHEALLQHAVALSYRGKLTRNRADLVAAHQAFEGLVAAQPRDAEAQMALAG